MEKKSLQYPIHGDHVGKVTSDPALWATFVLVATSFREFLNYWYFQDPDSGEVKILGEELWDGQETFVEIVSKNDKVFALKARKLGYTTLACAFDAWCLRFRDPNGRIHLFSRREHAAADLMQRVKFGMKRLPDWMGLEVIKNSSLEYSLRAGPDDERVCQAYSTTGDTAAEQSCTHAHLDEWARMQQPDKVWEAVRPTLTRSCHLITNGRGDGTYEAGFWKRSLSGGTGFFPMFVSATARPGRDKEFFSQIKNELTELQVKHQYPLHWQDALAGAEELVFSSDDLNMANELAVGKQKPIDSHAYVKSWDIGRTNDASVCIVLDVTDKPFQVVDYHRLRGVPFPAQQALIERVHDAFPGDTVIEDNAAGMAVRENLELDPFEVKGFNTTSKSKPKMINGLALAIQNHEFAYPAEFEQLDSEMRTYQWVDIGITQDSVMAAAIAVEHAKVSARGRRKGRIRTVVQV